MLSNGVNKNQLQNILEWITHDIKNDIRKREKLFILSIKEPSESNTKIYKQFRNQVLSNQRKAERDYYREQFEINKQDMRKSWKILKFLIGKEDKNAPKQISEFVINNKIVTDNTTIANSFNDYFVNVGKTLAQNIKCDVDPLSYIERSNNAITDPIITVDGIKTIVSQLNNSAAGHDGLPPSIMKQLSVEFAVPLTYLIHSSIIQGDFPEELKLAKVLPIYKADDEQLIQNYRPISVLPFFSKVFEKVIYQHVLDFIDSNSILYARQFGFRKGHSTSHAIITLVEKVSKALDTGKIVVGIYLDIRKAFDCVSHKILLDKLYKIGIRGNIHILLESYLLSRTQYVCYNDCNSDVKPIEYGVPQGSILGPLLFILYMNDFSNSSELLFSILFADDTSVFLEGNIYTKIIASLNAELLNVTTWLNANKLKINVKKTHYMVFHKAKVKTSGHDLIMQGNPIQCVTSTKFLGIIIDNKLKWNEHITYIKNKISKSIGILYKTRCYLDKIALKNMYYTFVFPYLIYCNEIWGNAAAVHLDPLIKLQKKCVRTLTFSDYQAPSEPIFQNLNILNFEKLVIQRISLMMFKYSIGEVPKPISQLFRTNNEYHQYNTRNGSCLHAPIGKSEAIYHTFKYRGIHIWNHISNKVSTDVSYACFKHLVKHYIQTNMIVLLLLVLPYNVLYMLQLSIEIIQTSTESYASVLYILFSPNI